MGESRTSQGVGGRLRVALFCGGRGAGTLIGALLRRSEIDLTLLVNAYDDGLSTGALRRFIPGMLGPSDFRKNFTYLISLYSNGQYALRNLLEFRIPEDMPRDQVLRLARLAEGGSDSLPAPLGAWVSGLDRASLRRIARLLALFFDYAEGAGEAFDYADCSLGNLIFAGAYLDSGGDFNRASAEIGEIVGARARLVNVSEGENRVLAGLKADGEILASEARIVGAQSAAPIHDLYFLERPLAAGELAELEALDFAGRAARMATLSSAPELSTAAEQALAEADVIIFGSGTQHSSLLPSYRIAREALARAAAPVRCQVMNLDEDHDIRGLSASDLVDLLLRYAAPAEPPEGLVTHVLLNRDAVAGRLPEGGLADPAYRGARVEAGAFANPWRPHVHNGAAVVERVLALWREASAGAAEPTVEVYADILNRSGGVAELVDDFLETGWDGARARLVVGAGEGFSGKLPQAAPVELSRAAAGPSDVTWFLRWLEEGRSDYLVLMSGDGAYSFQDVLNALRLLQQHDRLGAVFGSRTQSRRQFIGSIQSAYGENRALYGVAKVAAIVMSVALYLRSGVIFSDPLTGLRVFKRSRLAGAAAALTRRPPRTLIGVTRRLLRHGVEIAELPAEYRTFSGFTDPVWRMRRGLRALADLVRG